MNISSAKLLNKLQYLSFIYLYNLELLLTFQISQNNTFVLSEFDCDDELFIANKLDFGESKTLRLIAS